MIYFAIAFFVLGCIYLGLSYKYRSPYVDEIIRETDIISKRTPIPVGKIIFYKRTYKNGKVKYFEKRYK